MMKRRREINHHPKNKNQKKRVRIRKRMNDFVLFLYKIKKNLGCLIMFQYNLI